MASERPGLARGSYPERQDMPRTAAHLSPAFASRQLRSFADEVASQGPGLASLGQDEFRARREELRGRLQRAGIREELLASAFALVREAARRTLGTPHYDVQMMGGWAMANGMIAEMETGEGKTLAATLPACTAALAGIPVHVVSANDYLVARDARTLRPVYEALGLRVGAVTDALRDPEARRRAYACDVTYATTRSLAFDYLRDGLVRRQQRADSDPSSPPYLLRGLCFAIVDEADAVLIDEARTPLVLASPGECGEARRTYRRALRLARQLAPARDYRVLTRSRDIELTERGRAELETLSKPLGGIWAGPRRREEWALQALRAEHLFRRDRDYLVRDGTIQIIDAHTGRVAADRSWERGLQQLIELKEGCPITLGRETIARISVQRFYRRYLRLAGTTGTAHEVRRELRSVYGLPTLRIPTRQPLQRRAEGTRVYARAVDRWAAVVESTRRALATGRAVLLGTSSIEASELLSGYLTRAGIGHRVLNARNDADEAAVVAEAGQTGRVTIATQMAGRGTDIELAGEVARAGGLHVVSTERGGARRLDRQLHGRSGRQGDPGSFECIFSLEDESVAAHWPGWIALLAGRLSRSDGALPDWLGELLTCLPQRAEERRHARMRRNLMALEKDLGDVLAFSGPGE